MIRMPSRPRPKCTCGFCHVCSDDLVRFWADANRNNGWPAADLADGVERKTVAVGSLAAKANVVNPRYDTWRWSAVTKQFGADMAALNEQVRGDV